MIRQSIITIIIWALSSLSCMAKTNEFDQKTVKENDTLYVLENGRKYVVDNTIIRVKPKDSSYKLDNLYKTVYTSKSGSHYIEVPAGMDIEKFSTSLRESDLYESVDYVTECRFHLEPNDPHKTHQWYLNKINIKNAWNITTGNSNIKVAVIDTGVDRDYEDLGYSSNSNYTNISYTLGYDYINNTQYSTPDNLHGTSVASVLGAKTNNSLYGCGITGGNNSSGVTIISYRTINAAHVIQAINKAVIDGANIINLSFSISHNPDIDDAITNAYNHNVSVVCSTGNDGLSSICYPASNSLTIAVGASTQTDTRCTFSNYGNGIDLVAPGESIYLKGYSSSGYYTGSGTSLSTPIVSGTIALMLSRNPDLTPDEIRDILHKSATKGNGYTYNSNGWNSEMGHGILNAYLAVQLAPLKIVGPHYICDEEYYEIGNLPTGFSVEWSLSDSYYNQNCLEQNEPSANNCTITCSSSHIMMNETLTANIKYYGVTVRTLTMTGMYAYEDFQGHYTSGSLSGNINYTHTFSVKANATTYITSPMLVGATASYSSSGATPSIWSFNPTYGDITMVTTNTSVPVVININDICGNNYVLYAFASNQYGINVSNGENGITITLDENGDSQRGLTIDQSWTIEVRNATTGALMVTRSSTNRFETISTIGWPKGIYIVKVTIGKEELTEKVIVR
jgi:subtilisin family serine protease